MGGAPEGTKNMRTFSQIIEQEKLNRNILEIHLRKTEAKPRNLTFDDIGEFLFDILKINHDDCLGFDYTTGRYDSRQIKLKPSIDTTPYITLNPIIFMDHEITVKKQLSNVTKVLFKNVPLNVPDEEILNLCFCYGTVMNNTVQYEKLYNDRNKGMIGSNRYVEMVLYSGAALENFYWLEGPLPGDAGRRVTVLHNGQVQQCSNCLMKAYQGCNAAGNGKLCFEMKTPRTKMSIYMESLRHKVGYISLKMKHNEYQARNFPSLQGSSKPSYNMEENTDMLEEDDILPMNPIEEKDKKIVELTKALTAQKEEISEITKLKNDLAKAKDDLYTVKQSYNISQKKLNYTKNATEQKMAEAISNTEFYRDDPHLISVYSATLNLEDFENEETSDTLQPRNDNFMKKVEESIDTNDTVQNERYLHIKNQILDRVKTSKTRQRTLSGGSITSQSSRDSRSSSMKRGNPSGQDGRSPTRHRSGIPSFKQS